MSSDVYVSVNNRDDLGEPIDPSLRDSLMFRPGLLITEEEYAMLYGVHRIDYSGDIIYENIKPVPNRILFDGGYVKFSNKQPVYHFYLMDHQGNVRVVASADGTVEETNHYYPFGALFGESAGSNRQRYKYNGKELERLLALDWYDYGARWYDPVLARWHTVDPLAEKYPDISPYVYCHDNPVNKIDPDGMDDYYTIFGNYLYSDNKETDNIIIRNEELYRVKQKTGLSWMVTDIPFIEATLSAEAYSNIFTDILSKMEGVNVNNLYNSKVSVTVWNRDTNIKTSTNYFNEPSSAGDAIATIVPYKGKQLMTAFIFPKEDTKERELLSTISNVQNILGAHEYIGHFKRGLTGADHKKIFQIQKNHISWKKTTKHFKEYENDVINKNK